jgi:copper(I)-binding protein
MWAVENRLTAPASACACGVSQRRLLVVVALVQSLVTDACAATGVLGPAAPQGEAAAARPAAMAPAIAPAHAVEVTAGRINPAPAGQFETWAYATLSNPGKADALVEVHSADAESVVLRATNVTDAGRKARSVISIPLPAASVLRLTADTYFLAFIQARHAFVPGQRISATLRFASGAGRVVDFLVSDAEGDPGDAAQ